MKLCEKDIDYICEKYSKGESSLSLAKHFNVSQSTIIKTLGKKTKLRGNVKYHLNDSWLNKIDSSEKAYFLGFSFGDGNIYKPKGKNTYRFTLEIKESDKNILEEFNRLLEYTKPLVIRSRNSKWEKTASLIIYNQRICENLLRFGIVPNKTFSDLSPKINDDLLNHFVRGLFDSDGHIGKFCCSFLSGNNTCSLLEYFFSQNNIKFTKTKRDYNAPLFEFKVYSKKNLIKLRELLYLDAKIFLKRKYNDFKNISMTRRNSSLSEGQVITIKKRLKTKETCTSIARDHGVSRECISSIKNGRTWKWLEISEESH